MKHTYSYIASLFVIFFSLSSFNKNNACKNISSNIGYVKTQTEKAIETNDINIVKYHTYKALNAIEKSKKQFEECGCYTAELSLDKGLENLKNATKETSINTVRVLLKKALKNTVGSIHALKKYKASIFPANILAINTTSSKKSSQLHDVKILHAKIDKTLEKFERSLHDVVNNLECDKAYEYAYSVFKICENKLLNENLSEAKKYYNLKTKEIVTNALNELNNCSKKQ